MPPFPFPLATGCPASEYSRRIPVTHVDAEDGGWIELNLHGTTSNRCYHKANASTHKMLPNNTQLSVVIFESYGGGGRASAAPVLLVLQEHSRRTART